MTGKTKTKLQPADVAPTKMSRAREPNRADKTPTLQRKPAPARDARQLRAEGGPMASSSARQGFVARARQMRRLQRSAGNARVNRLAGMPLNAHQADLEKQSSQQTSRNVESSVQQTHTGAAPSRPVAQRKPSERDNGLPVQRQLQETQEEDELQMQAGPGTLQRQDLEDEELLRGKMEPVQRQEGMEELEEEELLQGQFDPVQRQGLEAAEVVQGQFTPGQATTQLKGDLGRRENRTGMPDQLKAGIENLSGMSMDDVKVHYNSSKPAQLNALAYTQGQDIEVGPGQERHLAHEGWHAVQQMQWRVKPTMQAKGVAINDEEGLEREADLMGGRALQMRRGYQVATGPSAQAAPAKQREVEPIEASDVPGAAVGASGEKGRLNFISIKPTMQMKGTVNVNDDTGLENEADVMGAKALASGQETFQAHAQGTDIRLASGQETHLPHEAWHVVQQKQGRMTPTLQMKPLLLARSSTPTAPLVIQRYVLKEDQDKATASLKADYKNDNIKISVVSEEQVDSFWSKHMSTYSLEQVTKKILGQYLTTEQQQSLNISVRLLIESGGIRLMYAVVDSTGEKNVTIFALNQVFKAEEEGSLEVYIETVTATGGGKKLFKESLLPLFADLKVKTLSLTASQIGGGNEGRLAWARYGFVPTQEDWNRMRKLGLTKLRTVMRWGNTAKMRNILQDTNPRAIRRFVLLSWDIGGDATKYLNEILTNEEWSGTLDLENSNDLDWITSYTNSTDKKLLIDQLKHTT